MKNRIDDPIVAEVRTVRAELAARHGGSVEAILKRAQEMDQSSSRASVRYPARRVVPVAGASSTPGRPMASAAKG